MRRRGWWHIPALLLLTVALFVAMWYIEANDKEDKQRREQIEERAASLEKQRDELLMRRDQLQRDFQEQSAIPATEQILILDLNWKVYSELYPRMEQERIPGVLGLSQGNLPGISGKISRDEFDTLLKDGWGTCLVCEDGSRFIEWDREITKLLSKEKITKPETVYFAEGQFNLTMVDTIQRCGYTIAVHHGEDRQELIAGDSGEGLWLVGANSWNYTGVRTEINNLIRKQGGQCFTLSFSQGRDEYDENAFENMMEFIKPLCEKDSLRITTFPEARRAHDPSLNGVADAQAAWERQDAELVEQIRVLDEQIQAIYAMWHES